MASRIKFSTSEKNYEGIMALLETSRNGYEKRLSSNCRVVTRGSNVAIQLHATDIITYTPDGLCILATHGWDTPTTRRYMEGYAPVCVFCKNFEMFVSDGETILPFEDGITVDLTTMKFVK